MEDNGAMGLMEAIERCETELTPVERRLTNAILAAPSEAAFLSVQELAQRAGADAAAAVRLARKLGFGGYRDLKSSLQSELVAQNDGHHRIRRSVDPASGEGVLAHLIDSEIEALTRLRAQMAEDRVGAVADTLKDARRIVLYGQGHATALVDLFARRLNRHGYAATAIREGQWAAAEAVAGIGRDDVLIAFAFYRMPELVPALLGHAGDVGARSVLITDLVGLSLAVAPTHTLAAVRGRPGESHTLGVPMLLVNAIMLKLTQCDGGRSLASLERLDEISQKLAGATTRQPAPRQKRR